MTDVLRVTTKRATSQVEKPVEDVWTVQVAGEWRDSVWQGVWQTRWQVSGKKSKKWLVDPDPAKALPASGLLHHFPSHCWRVEQASMWQRRQTVRSTTLGLEDEIMLRLHTKKKRGK